MLKLLNLVYEITPLCNSKCPFCYNVWVDNPAYPLGELNFHEIKKLFGKVLSGAPVKSVYITGGEPLLRADLEAVVSFLKGKGVIVGVATNGTLLDGPRARALCDAGVDEFAVSLTAPDGGTHDRLTGIPGGFQKACLAVTQVKKHRKSAVVMYCALAETVGRAPAVYDLAFGLGADMLLFSRFVPSRAPLRAQAAQVPTDEQLRGALSALDAKVGQYKMKVMAGAALPGPAAPADLRHIRLPGRCTCGRRKFTIDPVGNLRLCEQSPDIAGNLFDRSFLRLAFSRESRRFRESAKDSVLGCAAACQVP